MGELGLMEELCTEEQVLKHKGSHPIINIIKVAHLNNRLNDKY